MHNQSEFATTALIARTGPGPSAAPATMSLIAKRIVMARDIGIHGNLFGGTLMEWLDEAAAAFATEYCCTPNMVTVRVGELVFRRALKAGNHIRIYGSVSQLGKTSITLSMEARKFSLYSGAETVVCTTTMTFVRIDDDGTPTPIGASVRERHTERNEKRGTGSEVTEERGA